MGPLKGSAAREVPGSTIPMVAVFDTAFHNKMPERASCYAISQELAARHYIKRYGFHGIAHRSMLERYVTMTAASLEQVRLVTLQLGNGCSAAAEAVREKCVFTTHTPVPAGHDQFPIDLARRVIGSREDFFNLRDIFSFEGLLNMTYLALNLSRYVNGVAKKHGEVSRLMFTGYSIAAITNGVHAATWVAKPFQELYDRHIPGWQEDNFSLRYALSIPKQEMWEAHALAKKELIQHVTRTKRSKHEISGEG